MTSDTTPSVATIGRRSNALFDSLDERGKNVNKTQIGNNFVGFGPVADSVLHKDRVVDAIVPLRLSTSNGDEKKKSILASRFDAGKQTSLKLSLSRGKKSAAPR